MNTETQTPVQPELIWVDEKNLKKEGINLLRSQTALNKFIKECENVLKTELSEDVKINLKELKANALMTEVRKQFSFPNATDDFNLQSLGIDLNNARRLASVENWELYQFELSEMGEFIACDKQKMFDQYYYYAASEGRKQTIELANRLVELSEDAREKGLLDYDHLTMVTLAFRKIVLIEGKTFSAESRLVVNKEGIAVSVR